MKTKWVFWVFASKLVTFNQNTLQEKLSKKLNKLHHIFLPHSLKNRITDAWNFSFCYILERLCALENFILEQKVIFSLVFCIRKFLSQKGLKNNILPHNVPSRTALFQKSGAIILNRTEIVSCLQLGGYSEKSSLPKHSTIPDSQIALKESH